MDDLLIKFQDEVKAENNLDSRSIKKILKDDFKKFRKQTKSLTQGVKKIWINNLKVLHDYISLNQQISELNIPVAKLIYDLTKEKMCEDDCYKFLHNIKNSPISLRDYNDWWVLLKGFDRETQDFFFAALKCNQLNENLNHIYKRVVRDAQTKLVYEQYRDFSDFSGKQLNKYISDFKKFDSEVEKQEESYCFWCVFFR